MPLTLRSTHIHQRWQQVQGEGWTQHPMPSFEKCIVVDGHGEKLNKPMVPHDLGRTRERCELPQCEPIFGLCAQSGWKWKDRSVALSCSLSCCCCCCFKGGAGLIKGGGGRVTRRDTDGTLKAPWSGTSVPYTAATRGTQPSSPSRTGCGFPASRPNFSAIWLLPPVGHLTNSTPSG